MFIEVHFPTEMSGLEARKWIADRNLGIVMSALRGIPGFPRAMILVMEEG